MAVPPGKGDVKRCRIWGVEERIPQESLIFGGASLGFKAGTGITSAIMTGL